MDATERALLTGRWSGEVSLDLAKKTTEGAFKDVLTSPSARRLFSVRGSDVDAPLADWIELPASLDREQELVQLSVAVAALNAFLQANWTGPDLDFAPLDLLDLPPALAGTVTDDVLRDKAVAELAYGGEPAYHLAAAPALLLFAKRLTEYPYRHCPSAPWWRLRTWLVHQHLLDEPAAVPHLLQSLEPLAEALAGEPDLAGQLSLEKGLFEHRFAHDKNAAELFVRAAHETKLEYELTGALGKRTKFQQTDITQLVLLAESREREDDAQQTTTTTAQLASQESALPETLALNDDTLLEQTHFTSSSARAPAPPSRLRHIDPSSQPPLHPLDQCILLALCLNVKNTSPSHGLTTEQMSPYVARVISHPRNWSVHTMALLLRSRLEAHRTRTVERSTLQLQALLDQMPTADSPVSERLAYIHALALPSKWDMQRELAARLSALGVVKSALEIFERLEMWEDVARCYQSMEQRDKAVVVVRDLLEGTKAEADAVIARSKAAAAAAAAGAVSDTRRRVMDAAREAKLWCLLGDLEPERALEYYTRAWEVSGRTSGRAMRSLGGYHFARGEYGETVECLRRAVGVNPLLARSWFVLGCAHVRREEWEGAREAFARCVTIDDEDAESWNNLASVYLRMGEIGRKVEVADDEGERETAQKSAIAQEEPPRAIPFANKTLAFRALQRGLKFNYDNWRMWSNYMIVAMDVGELSEASRALARVVEERAAKDGAQAVDEDVLERLVDAVTRSNSNSGAASASADGGAHAQNANEGPALARRVTDLFERAILPRVSSPRIFRAHARLLTWQGRWKDALDAHMEAYRCGAAGSIEKGEADVERWREGVREVEDLVDVLRNFGPRVGDVPAGGEGFRWRGQARSVVRTFMGRTREFEDEPEWARLAELLEELKKTEE